MAFDGWFVRKAAADLSGSTAELEALKGALRTYQDGISSAWHGPEAQLMQEAAERLIAKIDRAERQIADGAESMNSAAAAKEAQDAAERAGTF